MLDNRVRNPEQLWFPGDTSHTCVFSIAAAVVLAAHTRTLLVSAAAAFSSQGTEHHNGKSGTDDHRNDDEQDKAYRLRNQGGHPPGTRGTRLSMQLQDT